MLRGFCGGGADNSPLNKGVVHSQAEERLCHRGSEAIRDLKRSRNKCAMTGIGLESLSKNEDLLNYTRYALSFFASKSAPIPTFPQKGRSKVAFTLAEVLITLGIIGVVAALTLPTLIQNYKEKQTFVKLKKTYAVLQNAFNMVRTQEHDGADVNNWDNLNDFTSEFAKYLNVSKICLKDKYQECIPDTYKNLNGKLVVIISPRANIDFGGIVLNDGTKILISVPFQEFISDRDRNNIFAQIFVDINGDLAPNTMGMDMFSFYVYRDKIVARGLSKPADFINEDDLELDTNFCDLKHTGSRHNGLGCTAHVINEEHMDYLKK